MKKALRVILSTLLTLTIVGSAVWYLTVYDPDFTRDTILTAAREFDKNGQHKTSAWLYDLAYRQSGGGDDVAIELANHYKSIGNYTKAEFTLSNAISDGGTADLYIALCQTYIEQDKILDAVNMLDNIRDPQILETISQLRPAAPTFSPDQAVHNQHITVTVSGDGSALYVNPNGEYPSTADTGNTSIQLPEGVTTIYAVAIDENYLVSPLSIRSYTVGGVIKQVTLADSALDAQMRELLNLSAGSAIYTNDLWAITSLELSEDITTYQDLIYFPYLKSLTITGKGSADLTVLSNLTGLTQLSITGVSLDQESLMAIGSLRFLEKITLSGCGLSTIAPLRDLHNVTYLDLSRNTLRNISVLSGYTKLQYLNMDSNALTDLQELSGLNNLLELNVSHNSLQTLQPLYGITGLTTLRAESNAIDSIEGLGVLTRLEVLTLGQNLLSDISSVSGCTRLTELDISNNSVEDITVVGSLTSLIRLDISYNQVNDMPKFESDHALASLYASHNKLRSIGTLNSLKNLYLVDLDYNENLISIEPLLGCYKISKVNCYGTKINRNPFPEEYSVVVNFDATANPTG